jgi:hypothetical protein
MGVIAVALNPGALSEGTLLEAFVTAHTLLCPCVVQGLYGWHDRPLVVN